MQAGRAAGKLHCCHSARKVGRRLGQARMAGGGDGAETAATALERSAAVEKRQAEDSQVGRALGTWSSCSQDMPVLCRLTSDSSFASLAPHLPLCTVLPLPKQATLSSQLRSGRFWLVHPLLTLSAPLLPLSLPCPLQRLRLTQGTAHRASLAAEQAQGVASRAQAEAEQANKAACTTTREVEVMKRKLEDLQNEVMAAKRQRLCLQVGRAAGWGEWQRAGSR